MTTAGGWHARVIRTVVTALLIATAAAAAQGTLTLRPAQDLHQFDRWIRVLMDSSVCDTCVGSDSRGALHRVWSDDSSRVVYQSNATFTGAPGQGWSRAVRLSPGGNCQSPIVYELAIPGGEPLVVTMWRETMFDQVEVMYRYQYAGIWPLSWSPTWCVTLKK